MFGENEIEWVREGQRGKSAYGEEKLKKERKGNLRFLAMLVVAVHQ